jgi:predicted dehydrogenase
MEDRRTFIKILAAGLAAPRSVFGANDRVQMGIIGTGMRGNQVYQSFMRNKDVVFVTGCDVRKSRLDKFVADSGTRMTAVGDYRRVLDNKDVDAVLITTPDHWHCPMVLEALQAGKDIYCEKPVSNTLEAALRMTEACRNTRQVVQVGCQQRSWQHFGDWATKIKEGYIGAINHCVLLFSGGGGFDPRQPEKPETPPPDLDWEMFQGPAPRRPYVPSRLNWRSWWDYGGGSITDWGVHLTDVMCWYMNADAKGPLLSSASYAYSSGVEDPQRAPDTFSVTWKYDNFVATFTNATPPGLPDLGMSDLYGNWFYGQKAVVLVNRYGYELKPVVRRARAGAPAPSEPPPALLPAERDIDPQGMSENPDSKFGSATVRHTRNFLDCVKSRSRATACPMDVGFNSTLPTLLAVMSVRQHKMFAWDGKAAQPA